MYAMLQLMKLNGKLENEEISSNQITDSSQGLNIIIVTTETLA